MSRRWLLLFALLPGGCAGILGIDPVPGVVVDGGAPLSDGAPGTVVGEGGVPAQGDAGGDGGCAYAIAADSGVLCGGPNDRCASSNDGCCANGQCGTSCDQAAVPDWQCESSAQCKRLAGALATKVACCARFVLDPTLQCPRLPAAEAKIESFCQGYLNDSADGCGASPVICRTEAGDVCPSGTVCTRVRVASATVTGDVGVCVPSP